MIVLDVTAPDHAPASKLALGCAPLGNLYAQVSDRQANRAVKAALSSGIRYFDTAPHYGLGLSERRLGHALAGRARNTFVVSTKVGRLLRRNPAPTGSDLANGFAVPDDLARVQDYSRDGVRRSIAESLVRLHLDYIDIALVHDPDDNMDEAITETIPALLELRDEGIVKAVGAGMNDWLALVRLVEETDLDTVMIAGRWTLLDRSGTPLLDVCRRRSVSVLAAAPLIRASWQAIPCVPAQHSITPRPTTADSTPPDDWLRYVVLTGLTSLPPLFNSRFDTQLSQRSYAGCAPKKKSPPTLRSSAPRSPANVGRSSNTKALITECQTALFRPARSVCERPSPLEPFQPIARESPR